MLFFEVSIYQKILKRSITVSTKTLSSTTDFNTVNNKKHLLITKSAYWNDFWSNTKLKKVILKFIHISQCYCFYGLRFKIHYFPYTVHYCGSSLPRLSETHIFLQRSSFWKARCALIGQLFSALWFAKYLKRVMEMLCPSTTASPRHGGGGNNTNRNLNFYK